MENNFYAVVMAGGRGERFWPQSRAARPKQLLRLIGNLTLIEQTVGRLNPLVSPENTLIITNREYTEPMRSLLPRLPSLNIIGEPVGRDTGPCVAMAAGTVRRLSGGNGKAVMVMLPSDQMIRDSAAMRQVLDDAGRLAVDTGKIVTIGIRPTYPSTGYGYIKCGGDITSPYQTVFHQGQGFKEKPNAETAEQMLAEGSYRWNSGIFIWTVDTIMNAFREYAPELAAMADAIAGADDPGAAMEAEYNRAQKISIDYAVMEKLPLSEILVAESTFDWDDVGSWNSLRNQIRPDEDDNVVRGLYKGVDVRNSVIVSDSDHLIAAIDIEDLVIVHTDDATLVCRTRSAQRIKELVAKIAADPDLKSLL